jgi:phage gp45-like
MWMSQRMMSAGGTQPRAEIGEVTGTMTGIAVQGESEHRGLPASAPYGIAYVPPDGTQAVILSCGASDICIGTVAENKNLQPGELMLYSAGGASIYLKNSGEVVINGQVFAPKGE